MIVRAYNPESDVELIARLFRDTIHAVNRADYSFEQIEAWAPAVIELSRWRSRLSALHVVVVEIDGELTGYCGWRRDGYIDLLFVHAAYQRRGIARTLYQTAEQSLRANGVRRLFTHASITAQPFFMRCGFNIVNHQNVEIRGVVLANAVMAKQLAQ